MPELFPDFTTSPADFQRAKTFWRELAFDQAQALDQLEEWAPWTNEGEWRDDPELMDGAVVFTLFSASQHKGLRVQQSAVCANPEKKPYVSSFMDVVGMNFLERPIPNLFIPSTETSR